MVNGYFGDDKMVSYKRLLAHFGTSPPYVKARLGWNEGLPEDINEYTANKVIQMVMEALYAEQDEMRHVVDHEGLFAIEPGWFNRNDPKTSRMCDGFCIPPGWDGLIRGLLLYIKARQNWFDSEYEQHKADRLPKLIDEYRAWWRGRQLQRRSECDGKGFTLPSSLTRPLVLVKRVFRTIWRWIARTPKRELFLYHWERDGNPLAPGNFEVVQVKEKMNGLRFYTEGCRDSDTRVAINVVESMSYYICIICGALTAQDSSYCRAHRE